ncbi:MAG: translocation/assembly module TamB domain-containing protein [Rickettsiales bacterium]
MKKYVLIAAGVVVGIVAVVYGAMQTPQAKRYAADFISKKASAPGRGVKVSGIHGHIPWNMALDEVRLSDEKGEWLIAHGLRIQWNPAAWARHRLDVDLLRAEKVTMLRRPVPAPPKKDAKQFDLASFRLPTLEVGNIAVDKIALPASMTGGVETAWRLNVNGNKAKKNAVTGALSTIRGRKTTLEFSAAAHKTLTFEAKFAEEPGGFVGALAKFPKDKKLEGNVSLDGNLDAFSGDAALTVGDMELLHARMKKNADAFVLVGAGEIPEEIAALPLPERMWRMKGEAEREGNVWRVKRSRFSLANAVAHAGGAYDVKKQIFEKMNLRLDIDDLSRWSELAKKTLSGEAHIAAVLNGPTEKLDISLLADTPKIKADAATLRDAAVSFVARIDAKHVESGWPLADFTVNGAATLNDRPVALIAKGNTFSGKRLALSDLSLSLPQIDATGKASYAIDDRFVYADLNVKEVRLAEWTQGKIRGVANVRIRAEGKIDDLNVTAEGAASELAGLPSPLSEWTNANAEYRLKAHYSPDALTVSQADVTSGEFSAKLQGSYPLAAKNESSTAKIIVARGDLPPISASATVARTEGALTVSPFLVEIKGIKAEGKAIYDVASGLATASATLNVDDFTALSGWFPMPKISGNVRANVALSPNDGNQGATWNAAAEGVSLPNSNLFAQRVALEGGVRDVASLAGLDVRLNASSVKIKDVILDAVSVDVSSPQGIQENAAFSATLRGKKGDAPVTLQTSGSAQKKERGAAVTVRALSGEYGKYPYRLLSPANLTIDGGDAALSGLAMKIADAVLSAKGEMTRGVVNASASLPETLLKPFVQEALPSAPDATFGASLKITGAASAPTANLDATLRVKPLRKELQATVFRLSAVWNNAERRPSVVGKIRATSGAPVGVGEFSFPATLSLAPFALNLKTDAPLRGKANLNVKPAQFNDWLEPMGHKLAGTLSGDVNVSGTLAKPTTDGALRWKNGAYDHLAFGACLRDIDMEATFDKARLRIQRLTAKGDRKHGDLNVTGVVDFAKKRVDAAVALDKLEAFCHGMAEGKIGGKLTVAGPLNAVMATGAVDVGPISVLIPTGGADAIPTVDSIYKSVLEAQERGEAKKGAFMFGIDVNLPQRVFVRGRGLDAEFEGKLRVEGTATRPTLDGDLHVKRGKMELLGSNLTITKGDIRFLDRNPVRPYVDMSATTKASDVDISVNVKGSIKKPDLSLTSSPLRPQDEILALLLFGRPLQEITPFQALQLAQAAATLAGKGGPGVLGLARETLGVDTLDISQDKSGGATVGAGKYVTDRVFVGVEQGAEPDSRRIKTEIEITPNVTAKTATGAEGGPTVGVDWKYDY